MFEIVLEVMIQTEPVNLECVEHDDGELARSYMQARQRSKQGLDLSIRSFPNHSIIIPLHSYRAFNGIILSGELDATKM